MITALYGGSFDPPHNGHISLAREVSERFGVDKFFFMPAHRSPLKPSCSEASDTDRLAMLRLATADEPRMEITDCELRRGGVSFTVDTLREWKKGHPCDRLLFVAGMDSLLSLHAWKEPLEIVSLCEFITFRRPGCVDLPEPERLNLPLDVSKRLLASVFTGHPVDVSSSDIRARVTAGFQIDHLVCGRVAEYIKEHGLYKNRSNQ